MPVQPDAPVTHGEFQAFQARLFEHLERQVARVDRRFDAVDVRFDEMDARFDDVCARLGTP